MSMCRSFTYIAIGHMCTQDKHPAGYLFWHSPKTPDGIDCWLVRSSSDIGTVLSILSAVPSLLSTLAVVPLVLFTLASLSDAPAPAASMVVDVFDSLQEFTCGQERVVVGWTGRLRCKDVRAVKWLIFTLYVETQGKPLPTTPDDGEGEGGW